MLGLFLSLACGDSLDNADDRFHAFDRYMFERSVIAVAACAEVWTGEPHKAELGTIGAAADGVAYGRNTF